MGAPLVEQVTQCFNNKDFGALESCFVDNCSFEGPLPEGVRRLPSPADGGKMLAGHFQQIEKALTGAKLRVVQQLANNDNFLVRYEISGVHESRYLGVEPSGRLQTLRCQDVLTVPVDKIVAVCHQPDRFAFVQEASSPSVPSLPSQGVELEEIAGFTPGHFPECVVVHPNGTVFVTLQFQGTIMRVAPGSEAEVFFQFPESALKGRLSGPACMCVDKAGQLLVDVVSDAPEYQGVWSFDPDTAEANKLASLEPLNNHLNGMALDDEGRIYVADSTLGAIWVVDQGATEGRIWCRDPLLARRQFVGRAPGANGLQFFDGALYASVSDTGLIVRIPVVEGGHAGLPLVHASGVPADDFAIDTDGAIYATTHVHNTLIRIEPSGVVSQVLAGEQDGLVGPTYAFLRHSDDGGKFLYITQDGGLLNPSRNMELHPCLFRVPLPGRLNQVQHEHDHSYQGKE